MSTTTSKLSALALAGFVSLTGIVSVVSPQAQAAESTTESSTASSSDLKCEGVKINAALVIDNSPSITTTELEKEVSEAYKNFINLAKESDKDSKITLFPMNTKSGNYYSKTFSLNKKDDFEILNSSIENFSFIHENSDIWSREDIFTLKESEDYGKPALSDLYFASKRAELVNDRKKKNFNFLLTISDYKVVSSGKFNGERDSLEDIGKNMRKKGVTTKSIIVTEGWEYSDPKEYPAKYPIPMMTSDKPVVGKDFFVGDVSKLKESLESSLRSYCKENKPKPKPSPKPSSETPTSTSTTPETTPTSEPIPEPTPEVSTPTVVETVENTSTETVTNTQKNTSTQTQQVVETEKETETNTETVNNTQTVKKAPQTAVETAVETQVVDNPVPVLQPAQQVPTPVYGPKVHTGGEVEKTSFIDKIKNLFS